jgi:uncharacterized RDD family membrane protein YckC
MDQDEPFSPEEARRILVEGGSGPEPCGLTIRIVAGILDFGVVVVVLFWLAVFTRQPTPDGSFELPVWAGIAFFIWWLLYYFAFEAFWNGQTPGKRATRIRVVMGSGRTVTAGAAARRTITRPIDSLPWVVPYAIAILFLLGTGPKRRQRIGDRWAGTKVIKI